MKKVLFFDFFGVFVEETVSKYYSYHHFTEEQRKEGNKVFRQGDLGNILFPEVMERLAAIDKTAPEEAEKQFFSFSKPNRETISLVRKLKKEGYKIYLLSNASTGHLCPLLEEYDLNTLFDKEFISAEIGHAKPDTDFWLYVLDNLGISGKDAVRIDDRIPNIEGAKKAGCGGILFLNAKQLEADIHALD